MWAICNIVAFAFFPYWRTQVCKPFHQDYSVKNIFFHQLEAGEPLLQLYIYEDFSLYEVERVGYEWDCECGLYITGIKYGVWTVTPVKMIYISHERRPSPPI